MKKKKIVCTLIPDAPITTKHTTFANAMSK